VAVTVLVAVSITDNVPALVDTTPSGDASRVNTYTADPSGSTTGDENPSLIGIVAVTVLVAVSITDTDALLDAERDADADWAPDPPPVGAWHAANAVTALTAARTADTRPAI
jgi:hypothetical protein